MFINQIILVSDEHFLRADFDLCSKQDVFVLIFINLTKIFVFLVLTDASKMQISAQITFKKKKDKVFP